MKKRFYIDTSVFGGYFDIEFEETTKELIAEVLRDKITILYSEMTESELVNAPEKVKNLIKSFPVDSIEYLEITREVLHLADSYIQEKVVGKTSREDCIHIALATLNRADVLISWNFKHIVNLKRIQGYNSVNLRFGYPIIEIRSPKEMIDYENNE
jgi:predicted nucleic acid-binding protein